MISLPRAYLAEAGASQNAVSPPAAFRFREPSRGAARLPRGLEKATPPANMVPWPDAGLPGARWRRPAPPSPSSERLRQEERRSACSRLGGRTSPLHSRYPDGKKTGIDSGCPFWRRAFPTVNVFQAVLSAALEHPPRV